MLNFVKGFLCVYWDNHMVFIFQFVNVVYHVDLWILRNPCIPGIKSTWSWCIILWILLARILLRILHLCSSVILACSFLSFFVWHLFGRIHLWSHLVLSFCLLEDFWLQFVFPWWTGKPGVFQSMGSQRVWHDWATEQQQHKRTFITI